jgi:hypothetical protein
MTALNQFEQAHAIVHALELAGKSIYCLCGNEFPNGQVSRVTYGCVEYANNRCPRCTEDDLERARR